MTDIKEIKEKKHKHIWKYDGSNVRVCEAPIPTIESCGKEEWMTINGWADSRDVIKARSEF
jgi:hypothetical protein